MPSSPFISLVALLWRYSSPFTSFLHCGTQNCTQCSRGDHTDAKHSWIIISFDWLAVPYLMHSRRQFALLAARAHY